MRAMFLFVLAGLIGTCAVAQSVEGRNIELKSGAQKSLNVPIPLKYDGPPVEGLVQVMQKETGKYAPATVRNGEFVFVPEGAMPGQTLHYVVEVAKGEGQGQPHVQIKKQEGKDILDVLIDDVLFTSYHYSNEWKKPFLWPLNSEGGVTITRDYPMDPNGTPKDHPHHKSFWTAYGDVNGVDCWAEGENSGFQHSGEVTFEPGNAYGWIHAKNTWEDKDHKPILSEEREYRFYATPENGRLFDLFVTFTADQGDVKFGDTKEGGIAAYRMREDMTELKGGVITNALGDKGEATNWGKPAAWSDYSAEIAGVGVRGLTVFDNAANLRYPTSWHVRNYGLNGANPFGYSYFSEKEYNKPLMPANGDYLLKSGEKLNFQYRVFVHSGDAEQAKVADRFTDYSTPPKAEWQK